jgi:zinc transport system substrate-binding protein
MKKTIAILLLLFTTFILASCQETESYDVVTTLFPQYDMAKAIAGDDLTVYNLLPFGTSPHSFEITSKDRQMIETSKLFIYTSDDLETWASEIVLSETRILNLEFELDVSHDEHDEHHDEHDDEHHEHDDVHFWTNPETMKHMVEIILEHMIEIKPELETTFTVRAESYLLQLDIYINELHSFFEGYENDDIHLYIAGHNAMADFGAYFHIEIVSLFPDFIPDAELSSLELTTFITELNKQQVKAFFIEPLFDSQPLAAQTIKDALDAQNQPTSFYELHQFHNISASDFKNNLSLFDIFEKNIENIKLVVELNYGTR